MTYDNAMQNLCKSKDFTTIKNPYLMQHSLFLFPIPANSSIFT